MCASPQSRGLPGRNGCDYLIGSERAITVREPHRVPTEAEAREALPKKHDSPVVAARMITRSEPVSGSNWPIIRSEPVSGSDWRNNWGDACVPTYKCRDHLVASGAITHCEVGGCFHWSDSAGGASGATQLTGMVPRGIAGGLRTISIPGVASCHLQRRTRGQEFVVCGRRQKRAVGQQRLSCSVKLHEHSNCLCFTREARYQQSGPPLHRRGAISMYFNERKTWK